ncbi:MAG: glycosyltransferase family 4 protein [bacterium]|nr:glycosyltransferase family 4 protein [bacterium]
MNFLGKMNHDDVVIYLKAADIFVLASVSTSGDREGTPTSIMEAMAAGLSIITTKVGGNPYLIREGENGLLVEEKNSNELARAMIKLINDENLRQKMRDKNLEDVKQKDWPIIAQKITKLYAQ